MQWISYFLTINAFPLISIIKKHGYKTPDLNLFWFDLKLLDLFENSNYNQQK